jgi:hypothetical protein
MRRIDNSLAQLDLLLGSRLENLIDKVPGADLIVSSQLLLNEKKFKERIKDFNNNESNSLVSHQLRVVEIFEEFNSLIYKILGDKFSLEKLVNYLTKNIDSHLDNHLFLSDKTIEEILHKLNPDNLRVLKNKGLFGKHSPRELLALTRFTETKEWQKKYMSHLKELDIESLDSLPITTMVLTSEEEKEVFGISPQVTKPWGVSHIKEGGVIMFFNAKNIREETNPLLNALLFFHYYFETRSAATFYKMNIGSGDKKAGQLIIDSMLSGQDKFEFFHPNLYTEDLFWKKGLELFFEVFKLKNADYFLETLNSGGYIEVDGEKIIISLNIIDTIWDMCFSEGNNSNKYFKERIQSTKSHFLYHFREGLWSKIFQDMMRQSDSQMERFLIQNLGLGDREMTQVGISTIIQ